MSSPPATPWPMRMGSARCITSGWRRASPSPARTATALTLTDAEVGQAISVVVGYTDGAGNAESLASAPTNAVIDLTHAPTGTVTIEGLAAWNEVLTAGNTLADADGLGLLHYQWQANGADIAGATGGSFHITPSQVGKAMTVVVSYTDGEGTAENVTSAATGAVAGYAETVFQAIAAGSRLDASALRPSNTAIMRGAAGNDTLLGGAGDDRLSGSAGHNVLDGGAGNDQVYTTVSPTEYDIIRGGSGDDSLTITLNATQLARADIHAALVALNTFESLVAVTNPGAHFVSAALHLDMTGVEHAYVRVDGVMKTLDAAGAPATGSLDSLWLG